MNRRDLIRTLLGTAAAGGMALTATAAEPTAGPCLFVLEAPGHIPAAFVEELTRRMVAALVGTSFEGSKVFVLAEGLKLSILGADGRVLNHPVLPKRRTKKGTHHA